MRYHALDGLRGLAAYIVVIGHFQLMTSVQWPLLGKGTGQIGVMLFFVLSGFLMGALYMQRSFTLENLRDFYQKRIARVVPLYLIMVLFCFVVGQTLPAVQVYNVNVGNLLQHLLFWKGESVLWTIAVEVQFYLMFPIFWLLFSRLGIVANAYILLAIVLIIGFAFPRTPVVLQYLHFFLIGLLVSSMARLPRGLGAWMFVLSFSAFVLSAKRRWTPFSPNSSNLSKSITSPL